MIYICGRSHRSLFLDMVIEEGHPLLFPEKHVLRTEIPQNNSCFRSAETKSRNGVS
ncbi:hypothetical protein BRARA_F00851 [Brassica rapa]|uniref:Uncharacterized protein n=1 Tax=Brassica campestris TaxID=3711 RepID=A0A397YW78_BRACM|nr:hypothetical protein BRARA_F00851 [Brassica rapa]